MNDINKYIEIDSYLSGNLSGEALDVFNAKMKGDEAFREEVDSMRLANQVILSNAHVDIKNRLKNIHAAHRKSQRQKKWFLSGFIVLMTLVVSGIAIDYFSNKNREINPHEPSFNEIKEGKEETNIIHSDNNSQELIIEEEKSSTNNNLATLEVGESDTIISLVESDEVMAESDDKIIEENMVQPNDKEENKGDESSEGTALVTPTKNPCEKVNTITPSYDIQWPCLGYKQGSFELLSSTNNEVNFSEYSLDGGKSFTSISGSKIINVGTYELIVKDEAGCLTKPQRVKVNYRNCNFVIQPKYGKYWELNFSKYIDVPVVLEIRNARTAQIVYQENIEHTDSFIWQGKDLNNNSLPLGNYVYSFTTSEKGLIAQGQITVVN